MAAPTEAWFYAQLIDLCTGITGPDDLRRLHRDFASRYPFLLQSTAHDGELGRYDILFASPGESLQLQAAGRLRGPHADSSNNFLSALDTWWSAEQIPTASDKLPFVGGWFVYLGYELAAQIEPGLTLTADAALPTAFAVRCKAALVFDHASSRSFLVCEDEVSSIATQLQRDIDSIRDAANNESVRLTTVAEEPPEVFLDAVVAAKKHISAGDIYQANLSRQWSVSLDGDASASDIYASLCRSNPAPFAGIARWRDIDVISSSPERLLRLRDGTASTRPIAGTRPRSDDDWIDNSLSAELLAHPKEVAEHVMLIDLERNDLGRVCEAGSVQVDEMMVLESYAHVHHIVSNVSGQLRRDVTPGQAIAAVFPGGTITGCPKVRCMEIISELEDSARGAYTGAFGYLNRDGSLDLNILIRTMVKQGNQLTFRAGSGIVADSDPEAELLETRAKAEGLLRAFAP